MRSKFQIFLTVASLLSSLHQLKEENIDLKDSVDQYVQRRDHLLAVRARLMALNNLTVTSVSGSNNSASTLVTTIGVGGSNPSTSSEVGDGIAHGLLNRWTDIFILPRPAFNPNNAAQTHSIFVKL